MRFVKPGLKKASSILEDRKVKVRIDFASFVADILGRGFKK